MENTEWRNSQYCGSDFRFRRHIRCFEISHLKSETSNLKSQTSNLTSRISNLKSEISNLKSEILRAFVPWWPN